jgi:hypothetical protein
MIRHLSRLSRFTRWRYLRWVIVAPTLPLALWACTANPLQEPKPLPEQQNDQYYEVNPVRDIDILFTIDNSPSMQEEQNKLNAQFPVFMNELKKIPGGLPNVHIGVISSDLGAGAGFMGAGACARPGGDRGIFQKKATCGLDANSLFISSFNNQTMNNFMGDITQVFTCMANLGAQGCGYEHQLQATRVALYESITKENAGFLRPDAFLALIMLTDEDDCSAETTSDLFNDETTYPMSAASFRCAQTGHVCDGKQPPVDVFSAPLNNCKANPAGRLIKIPEIVDSIRALKKRPDQQILVSGIIGWPKNPDGVQYRYARGGNGNNLDYVPVCQSNNGGDANGGLRMKEFVESFGSSGSIFSICDEDFSPAMKQIGEKLAAKLGNPCISAPVVDTKPAAGVQPDCQVIDKIPGSGPGGFKDEALPPCSSGRKSAGGACWQLAADAGCGESGFKIDVDRGGKLAVPGTQQAIKCLTCAKPGDPRCAGRM